MSQYFESQSANQAWEMYFRRVDRVLASIPLEVANETRAELESHAYSLVQSTGDTDVVEGLNRAFEKLGEPEEYLQTIVSDWWLSNASRNRSLLNVLRAVRHSFGTGVRRTLRAIALATGLAVALALLFVGFMKILFWEQVGLFIHEGGGFSYGWLPGSSPSEEVLGIWFIPISWLLAWGIYRILAAKLSFIRN